MVAALRRRLTELSSLVDELALHGLTREPA
jgi:hypothetical protein